MSEYVIIDKSAIVEDTSEYYNYGNQKLSSGEVHASNLSVDSGDTDFLDNVEIDLYSKVGPFEVNV